MNELLEKEISDQTINTMIEMNPNIKELTRQEIKDKIVLLDGIKCSINQIKNIIFSNSMYFNRTNEEIINLINYLLEKGFQNLNILFDANPYILNLDSFEIDNYINEKIKNKENLEDIIDNLESNPELFNEI